METFRNLKLIGSTDEQENLLDRIEQSLREGWTRDGVKEMEMEASRRLKYKIFVCSKLGSRPAASLFFIADKNNYLYVCNIVSREPGQLGVEKYNAILDEFQSKFIEPAVKDLDIQIITTPAERTIDNSMSPEMAQLLKRFSVAANKSSGGTHPYDEQRFFDFIVKAHEEGSLLDESQLRGLLIDDGWTDEDAFELSCKYCFGRGLLQHQDKK